jgi:GH25 family lysozyme M1 (1,4-beta-N-acetylmuramidase)
MPTYGIDISLWQGKMDWQKAVHQGAQFAILKASQGLSIDPRFKENMASCPLAYRGAYHFLTRSSGKEQAQFFLDTVGDSCTLVGALDVECIWDYFSEAVQTAWEFVQEYKRLTNLWPILYTNSSIADHMQWDAKEKKYKFYFRNFVNCPLWITNYDQVERPVTGPWLQEHLQQITDRGHGELFGAESKGLDIDKAIMPIDLLLINPLVVPEPPKIEWPTKTPDVIVKPIRHRKTYPTE